MLSNRLNDLPIEKLRKQLLFYLFNVLKVERIGVQCVFQPLPSPKHYANLLIKQCLHTSIFTQLIDMMLNTTELVQPAIGNTITHGQLFVHTYKISIFDYLLQIPDTTIARIGLGLSTKNFEYICKLLIELSEYVHKHKRYDQTIQKNIFKSMLDLFPKMLNIVEKERIEDSNIAIPITTIELNSCVLIEWMSHVAMICPYKLTEINKSTIGLDHWILGIISRKDYSLELKARAIFLMPCIIDEFDLENANIGSALNSLQNHFPLKSTEFPVGSLERSTFVNVFQKLLDALAQSKSIIILKFVINATAADEKHILEYAIEQSLVTFSMNQTVDQQTATLEVPFHIFSDISLEPSTRLVIVKRFFLTMIRHCCMDAILKFFTQHMRKVWDMSGSNYGLASSGWAVEQALVSRIGAYQLVEALVSVVPKEHLQNNALLKNTLPG